MCDNGNIMNEYIFYPTAAVTSTDVTTTWIDPYLVKQPPAIVYGDITSDTQNIYIPWTYPPQINVGFMNNNLPLIVSFTSNIITSSGQISIRDKISTGYINDYYTNTSNAVTGIILTINNLQPGKTIPGINSYNSNNYYYYNVTGIDLGVSSNVISWYQNYSNLAPNTTTTPNLPLFITAGPPGVPQLLILIAGASINISNISVTYNPPTYTDSSNNNNIPVIINYKIYYESQLSLIRYGTALSSNIGTITVSGTTYANTLTPLYPDTPYQVSVSAINNINPLYGDSNTLTTTTTNSLSNIVGISGTIPISLTFLSGTRIIDNLLVSTLITNSTTKTSTAIITPINTVNNRGKLGPSSKLLMILTSNIVSTPALSPVSTIGPKFEYYGFGGVVPVSTTTNNIRFIQNSITDAYSASFDYNQGFYQNANLYVQLLTTIFTGSPNVYTLNLIQNFSNVAPTAIPQQISTLSYYYDNTTGNPTAPSATIITLASALFSQFSGIYCISNGDIVVTILNNSIQNMGIFFYKDAMVSTLITIGTDDSTSDTSGTSAVTSGKSGNKFTTGAITINYQATFSSLSTTLFSTSMTILSTFYNVNGFVNGTSNTISAIIDYASYNIPRLSTIENITLDNDITGCRVYSGPSSNTYLYIASPINTQYPANTVPNYLYNGTTQYANIIYNNSWDITQSSIINGYLTQTIDAKSELQLTDGGYTTKGNTNAYLNYNGKKYYNGGVQTNTLDYSGISSSGYRYATFAWKILNNGQGYNSLTFKINDISSGEYIDSSTIPITIGGNKLQLYYRFEQNSSPTPTNSSSTSSIWSDANSLISPGNINISFQNGNYFGTGTSTPDVIYYGYLPGTPPSVSLPTITFPVSCPNLIAYTNVDYTFLYCRIGLPMISNFKFSSITATFKYI